VSKSKAKGTTAEREVVRYLQQWWPAAERRALSGNKDKGDVAGIPGTVVEVKAAARLELAAWRRETWTEMENAGAHTCVLVVKRPYKSVGQWDAFMPQNLLPHEVSEIDEEGEAESWLRMDLRLAVAMLEMILDREPSFPSY
jgi:Holliday junction resolvase